MQASKEEEEEESLQVLPPRYQKNSINNIITHAGREVESVDYRKREEQLLGCYLPYWPV